MLHFWEFSLLVSGESGLEREAATVSPGSHLSPRATCRSSRACPWLGAAVTWHGDNLLVPGATSAPFQPGLLLALQEACQTKALMVLCGRDGGIRGSVKKMDYYRPSDSTEIFVVGCY